MATDSSSEHHNSDAAGGHGGPSPSVLAAIWGGTAHVVLLTLLVVALHGLDQPLLQDTDGYLLRGALQTYASARYDKVFVAKPGPEEPGGGVDNVNVIEASAYLRVDKLEVDKPSEPDVLRVGGVRPIDRKKFAQLLHALASRLAVLNNKPRVIGIDIDITPLAEGDDGILQALDALRHEVPVVAIVAARDEVASRQIRNQFMSQQCQRHEDDFGKRLKPLYFASPRVFHDFYSYPLHFPAESAHAQSGNKSLPHESPKAGFPSLANVVRMVAWPASEETDSTPTLLCDQAAAALQRKDGSILEDQIDSETGSEEPFRLDAYEERWINWRWLEDETVGVVPLRSFEQFRACTDPTLDCIPDAVFRSASVLISIDGGARHDKFDVAAISPDPISGATLHALQAVSGRPGKGLNPHSVVGVLIDVIAGVVFLCLWVPIQRVVPQGLNRLPSARFVFLLLAPLCLAGAMSWICTTWVSPALLASDLWVNPAYLLFGMVLHAYVEASHGDHAAPAKAPDFTFGMCRWWTCPSPMQAGMPPAAKRAAWRECVDASVGVAFQWWVVGVALVVLCHVDHHASLMHQRYWAVIVIAALGIWSWRHQRKEGHGT